jgi:hypothetical protein
MTITFNLLKEKFEDTKAVIRGCKSMDRQYYGVIRTLSLQLYPWNCKRHVNVEPLRIYKTLHRNLK